MSLIAPLKPMFGPQGKKADVTAPRGEPLKPHDEMPRGGLVSTQPEAASVSRGTPQDDLAQDANAASITARALQARVHEAFAAHFSYPPFARQNGWQGEVRIGLRIEPNGELTRVHILVSSGYGILDRAALRSLKAVGSLINAQDLLKGIGFDLVLPIRYRLLDS